ncbi:MAG: hypothetical protein A2X49_10265 [Lentisphaerae bacterium GWF2_52_8]|nr:MAG: hypothetical protein A2X49_10265 [Lentisphaerae bacterium GWF2_52_8]
MIINTNISSLLATRYLNINMGKMAVSMERLSSGDRINRAADDPGGLAMSERLKSRYRGINTAVTNAQTAISMTQTADDSLGEIGSLLQRLRDLAVQASSDTVSVDRAVLQNEADQLVEEIDRLASITEFNDTKLFTGTYETSGLNIHVGPDRNDTIELNFSEVTSTELKVSSFDISTQLAAENAITSADSGLSILNLERSRVGAYQNRLTSAVNYNTAASVNEQAAYASIRDTDFASEYSSFTRNQILVQTGAAMLAQANLLPQNVFQLIFSK